MKNLIYSVCLCSLVLLLNSCDNPASSSSNSSETENTVNSDFAPTSVLKKTLTIGTTGPYTIKFTNDTTCSLPNYTLPSGYLWNKHPTYTYSYRSSTCAVIGESFKLITSGSSTTMKKTYYYTYTLTFSSSTSGTYTATEKAILVIVASGVSSTSYGSFKGNFTLK
jgi:hypothetical protein